MIPWEEIDRTDLPGSTDALALYRRGAEFSIRIAGTELMNSRCHASEEAMATEVCRRLEGKAGLHLLMGGLGMGFTLAAALKVLGAQARVTVSELLPAVIQWNLDYFGPLAGSPLEDIRVNVINEDVADTIRRGAPWDAILLDVDNGPQGLTMAANNRLYDTRGLSTARRALTPGGLFAVWSCAPDAAFTRRLRHCGFKTDVFTVRARRGAKGSRHVVWISERE